MIESELDELAAARQEHETGFASLVEHFETLLWDTTYPSGLARRTALSVVHGRALDENARRERASRNTLQ